MASSILRYCRVNRSLLFLCLDMVQQRVSMYVNTESKPSSLAIMVFNLSLASAKCTEEMKSQAMRATGHFQGTSFASRPSQPLL